MGLVVVVLTARFGGYDALPDPVGWGLVLAGLLPLRDRLPGARTAAWLAATAGVVAVPLWLPTVRAALAPSAEWALSLPQTACCVALCAGLATACDRAGEREAARFGLLRWVFVALAVAPVLVYGGGQSDLAVPVAVGSVLANVVLVWLLFRVSRRPWAGGPAPVPSGNAAGPPPVGDGPAD